MSALAHRMDRLAARGRAAAESAGAEIDWGIPVKPPSWMTRRAYITAISQLYYGELATTEMCRRLVTTLTDPAAAAFIRTQIADEERHAGFYERYLHRAGAIGDIEEGVAMAYQGALAWRGPHHGSIVAFHLVMEGEGLRLQTLYSNWFPCPLYAQMNAAIARDEARHVAFGKIYLRETLGELSREERIEIFRWIRTLWFDCADAIRTEMPQAVKLLLGRKWLDERWRQQSRALVDIGLIGKDEAGLFERC